MDTLTDLHTIATGLWVAFMLACSLLLVSLVRAAHRMMQ
jgi:hypothetical protein